MLGGIGLPELIVVFLVILLLFGSKALPEVAKGLAQAIKTFKKEVTEVNSSINDEQVIAPSTPKDVSNDFNPDLVRRDWRPKAEG